MSLPCRRFNVQLFVCGLVAAAMVLFAFPKDAGAVPSFARKYQTSCQTCHTVYPMLNSFGEAFRRIGYRFPSESGSVDSDAVKGAMIPLGQEEYTQTFPKSVWPDKIMEGVPFSMMLNGSTSLNFPDSDAKSAAGSVWSWQPNPLELHLFGAGALNDTLTYFSQLTVNMQGQLDIETAYMMWSDIVGPRHAVNLWMGRLFAPQLSSFGLHSSYLADTFSPGVSIAGLFSSKSSGVVGKGHSDGMEVNGIIHHRIGWSLGWIASQNGAGVTPSIDAEDVYAHIGIKSGGIALDGEGKYGPSAPDPQKPWAEKSITFDLFAYHGLNVFDNQTQASPSAQRDVFNVLGGSIRAQWNDAMLTSGIQFEYHTRPNAGTAPTLNTDGTTTNGTASTASGQGWVQYNELNYTVFPWFIPGVRTEFTYADGATLEYATLLRVIPGIAMLARPNLRIVVTGDFEYGHGLPVVGGWGAAGGQIMSPTSGVSKLEAEQINLTAAVAF